MGRMISLGEKLVQESDRPATGGNKEKRKKKERGRAAQNGNKMEGKEKIIIMIIRYGALQGRWDVTRCWASRGALHFFLNLKNPCHMSLEIFLDSFVWISTTFQYKITSTTRFFYT